MGRFLSLATGRERPIAVIDTSYFQRAADIIHGNIGVDVVDRRPESTFAYTYISSAENLSIRGMRERFRNS